jgi:fatty-acyl-CoA synthase
MRKLHTSDGVGSWIERRARVAPDAAAVIWGDRSFTYAELAGRIRRLAGGLTSLGVGHGDRVAWVGPNHPAFLEAFFACGLIGAALAPVNHRLPPDRIGAVMATAEPAVAIRNTSDDLDPLPPSVRHVVAVAGPAPGSTGYEALVEDSPEDPGGRVVGMEDLCLLPHTSGTTGEPKRIALTHANLTWNVVNFLSCADFRERDVTPAIAPFFRVGGVAVNVLPVLFLGGTVVIPTEGTPDEILQVIERHRVTVGFGNPDSLEALAKSERWPGADLSSVRFIVTGGAPVPERLIRAYLDRGVTMQQGYGLSEAAPLALLLDADDALRKIGSAGKPPLLVDVRIADEQGGDVGSGATGELLVRGPNVMAGYWNQPEATRRALSTDGWLRTGDAARMDDEGFVWIVDRMAARIDLAGRTVFPGDVERVLAEHPSVAEAGVTAATGGLVALVVAAPGAAPTGDELMAFSRDRLAPHEVPAAVRFVQQLPRNSVGKLVRAELQALAERPDLSR